MTIMSDIAFAVSMLSQSISKASSPHWMAIKHIRRYLKGNSNYTLVARILLF